MTTEAIPKSYIGTRTISHEQRKFNRKATAVLAAVALTATGLLAYRDRSEASIPSNAPRVTVSVDQPGEGADAVIAQVEPAALDNPDMKQALDTYIENQGKAANGDLKYEQRVIVPIVEPATKK
jgi:hypothetical protein